MRSNSPSPSSAQEGRDMLRSRTRDSPDRNELLPLYNDKSARKALDKRLASAGFVRKKLLSIRHQWTLMTASSKVACFVLGVFVFLHVILGTLDVFFHYYGLPSSNHDKQSNATSFAVVINTYKRPQMLREAVNHYADTCGRKFGVSQVFVVWAEEGVTPPDGSSLFFRQDSNQNRAHVQIVPVAKDSLNSRFEPIPELESDAIFMVDDDVRVSCPTLYHGFQAWTAFPQAMVGYYPRLASAPRRSKKEDGEYVYHAWPAVFFRSSFNFVLTKASFLHKQYLALYSNHERHPLEILDYVDQHKNCEDVAMSLLVANYTRSVYGTPSYPIYVEGAVKDMGLFGGISTGSGHMGTRSTCLTELTKIYQSHGWDAPLSYRESLTKQSWVHHYPGFWWQYRPSNMFEWGALGNVFS